MLSKRTELLALITVIMVTVFVANIVLLGGLSNFGISPGRLSKIWCIFTAPWIHSGLFHILRNLLPLLILSWLCMTRSIDYYITASIFIITVSGLLVWVFGRGGSHLGASGWVYGLWALLIANAYFERSIKSLIIGVITLLLFSTSMVWGLMPSVRTSFEGHIMGMISGILFAWLTVRNKSLRAKALRDRR